MKVISVILLALITSFVIIKGQQRKDTIQIERIDNLPNIDRQDEVTHSNLDSLTIELQKQVEKAIELHKIDEVSRKRELDSENKLIQEQKKLIITLLENEVRSDNN